jgi:hypothetical protein
VDRLGDVLQTLVRKSNLPRLVSLAKRREKASGRGLSGSAQIWCRPGQHPPYWYQNRSVSWAQDCVSAGHRRAGSGSADVPPRIAALQRAPCEPLRPRQRASHRANRAVHPEGEPEHDDWLAFPGYFPVTAPSRVFRRKEIPGIGISKLPPHVLQVSELTDVMGDAAGRFRARIRFFSGIFPVKPGI